jgi:RHS repeat-associated protein
MGRTAFEKRTILGTSAVTNTIGYTYNLDGSVATLTYPNTGKVITYLPGGAGRTLTAQDIAGSINYVQNAHYAPFGGLTSMTNGAQPITTTNTYNSRLQPVTLSAATSAATILSLSYDFHAGAGDNGNVFQIVNNRDNNRTQNFTYDALNRIQQGNSTGANWGEAFTIDAWGNLTNRSAVTGKTNFEGLSVTALVSNRLSGFGYDAAGNMTSNGSATYTYDAENRLLTTAGVTYAYDGGGKRVKKSSGTLYWTGMGSDNLSESDLTGVIQKEYIFFNSKRVARRDVPGTPSVKYYFSDHLGSASIVTDTIGTMIACPTNSSLITGEDESDYYPYGGEMQLCNRVSQDYKFTGKQRDGESGLDNFGARYDASSLGRFMTPDWSAGADPIPFVVPGQPQSLNLYSYVMNDPILVADADGHFCMDSFGICDSNSGPGSLSAAMVAAVSNVHSGFASVNSALDDDSRFSPFMWEFWTPPMVPGNVKEAMGDSVDASNKKGGLNGSDHKGGFHEEGGYAFPSCSGNCSSLTVVPSLPGAYSDPSVDASATMGFTAADRAKMQLMMDAGQSPDIFWHVHPKGKKGGHDFAQGPSDQDKDIAAGRVNIVVGARNMRVYFYDNNGAVHSMSWKQFMKDRY